MALKCKKLTTDFTKSEVQKAETYDSEVTAQYELGFVSGWLVRRMIRILARINPFPSFGKLRNIFTARTRRLIRRLEWFVAIELAALTALDFEAVGRERRLARSNGVFLLGRDDKGHGNVYATFPILTKFIALVESTSGAPLFRRIRRFATLPSAGKLFTQAVERAYRADAGVSPAKAFFI